MSRDEIKLRRCVACGRPVPEREQPPYPDHAADCRLVKEWTAGAMNNVVSRRELARLILDYGHNDDCLFCGFKDKLATAVLAAEECEEVHREVQRVDTTERTFMQELEGLINRHSIENESNTPDHLLATYVRGCLTVFAGVTMLREQWYGRSNIPGSPEGICTSPGPAGTVALPENPKAWVPASRAKDYLRLKAQEHYQRSTTLAELVELVWDAYLMGKAEVQLKDWNIEQPDMDKLRKLASGAFQIDARNLLDRCATRLVHGDGCECPACFDLAKDLQAELAGIAKGSGARRGTLKRLEEIQEECRELANVGAYGPHPRVVSGCAVVEPTGPEMPEGVPVNPEGYFLATDPGYLLGFQVKLKQTLTDFMNEPVSVKTALRIRGEMDEYLSRCWRAGQMTKPLVCFVQYDLHSDDPWAILFYEKEAATR